MGILLDDVAREFGKTINWAPQAPPVGPAPAAFNLSATIDEPNELDDDYPGEGYIRVFAKFGDFITAPAKGDRCTIGGVEYLVNDIDRDFEGGVTALVKKA